IDERKTLPIPTVVTDLVLRPRERAETLVTTARTAAHHVPQPRRNVQQVHRRPRAVLLRPRLTDRSDRPAARAVQVVQAARELLLQLAPRLRPDHVLVHMDRAGNSILRTATGVAAGAPTLRVDPRHPLLGRNADLREQEVDTLLARRRADEVDVR